MRKLLLAAVLVLMASGAQASSYLDIFGTVHDPILTRSGAVHSYSGPNLAPGASLAYADLAQAALVNASLTNAYLYNAYLRGANLTGADLSGADLSGAALYQVNLSGTNLSGANLFNASGLTNTSGTPDYDALTNFSDTFFDPVAAGWNLVPEPSTALLVGLGFVGMAARRRV